MSAPGTDDPTPMRSEGPTASDPADDFDFDFGDDDCCQTCGGEGFIFDCFDGFCADADWGCDDCTRPCPDCIEHTLESRVSE